MSAAARRRDERSIAALRGDFRSCRKFFPDGREQVASQLPLQRLRTAFSDRIGVAEAVVSQIQDWIESAGILFAMTLVYVPP